VWSASSIRFGACLAPYHPLAADPGPAYVKEPAQEPIADTFKKIEAEFGKVDIVVNHAGISPAKSCDTVTDGDWPAVQPRAHALSPSPPLVPAPPEPPAPSGRPADGSS